MNDDISMEELMEFILKTCVREGTEYFYLSHNHQCVAEFRKGVIFTDTSMQRVHDVPNFRRYDFYVCFKSRYPKKEKEVKAKDEGPVVESDSGEEDTPTAEE